MKKIETKVETQISGKIKRRESKNAGKNSQYQLIWLRKGKWIFSVPMKKQKSNFMLSEVESKFSDFFDSVAP